VADLLIRRARVQTMDSSNPSAQALALGAGRVIAAGSEADLDGLRTVHTRVLDAAGATVLPGLIDAHGHFGHVARSMAAAVDCRTPPCRSVADIVARARARARECPPGTWILLQGTTFQDELLADRRFPEPAELDTASESHPIVYRSSLHHLVLNRRALQDARIDADTPTPPGTHIERDPDTGEPTGVLAEMFDRLPIPPASESQLASSIERTAWEHYLANGVTSIQEIWDSPAPMELISQAQLAGDLPLRVRAYGWVPLAGSVEEVAAGRIGGAHVREHWLEAGGVKLFVDGGTSSHTAAFYEPYLDAPDTRGALNHELTELVQTIAHANHAGAQVAIHACGDLATDISLAAIELAGVDESLRPRIEHGGNTAWNEARTAWARRLGVLPVANLGFIYNYGEFWPRSLGPGRAIPCVPLRTLLHAGFPVPGTSDTTGGDPRLLNPFHNMWCAVTRHTFTGRVIDPQERIALQEALRMYTLNAAHAGRIETSRGSLAPGKLADAVVLDRSLERLPDEEIADVKVLHTIVAGEIVYSQGARVSPAGAAPGPARTPAPGPQPAGGGH
jgi:predicted amidohydrolase YtcJ